MADEQLMQRALALAEQGLGEGQFPIGSLVAVGEEIVSEAYWRGLRGGLLLHPELAALMAADEPLRGRRAQATLYTTLEPCLMCMGAATSSFVRRIVFALESPADGASAALAAWAPPAGHPAPGVPAAYGVPEVVSGVGRARAIELMASYLKTAEGPEALWGRTLPTA